MFKFEIRFTDNRFTNIRCSLDKSVSIKVIKKNSNDSNLVLKVCIS